VMRLWDATRQVPASSSWTSARRTARRSTTTSNRFSLNTRRTWLPETRSTWEPGRRSASSTRGASSRARSGGFGLESGGDLFVGVDALSVVVVGVGVGEGGWSFADEQDRGAVGSDVVGAAVVGPPCSPSVHVFVTVVGPAAGVGVGLVGE